MHFVVFIYGQIHHTSWKTRPHQCGDANLAVPGMGQVHALLGVFVNAAVAPGGHGAWMRGVVTCHAALKLVQNVNQLKRKRSAFVTKGLNTFTGMVGSGHGSRTRHEHNHAWRSIRFHAMPARAHGLPCRPHCGTVRDRRGTRSARMRRQSCA